MGTSIKKLWFELNIKFWRAGEIIKRLARVPLIDRLIGPLLWNEKNLDSTYIPVVENIDIPDGTALPVSLIEELLSATEFRFLLSKCPCRTSGKCSSYPREPGCLFLGEAARDIDPQLGREVSISEAMDHVRRSFSSGLIPNIVHGSFDASLLLIDYRKMLAICFCCDCCCAFRSNMKGGPVSYRDRIMRIPGSSMRGTGNCEHCGRCERACFLGAVHVTEEGPVFSEFCKCCGRCAMECPANNIELVLDPAVDFKEQILRRISSRTKI